MHACRCITYVSMLATSGRPLFDMRTVCVCVFAQVRSGRNFVVGCMNNVVHSYQPNGHKNHSLFLPSRCDARQLPPALFLI